MNYINAATFIDLAMPAWALGQYTLICGYGYVEAIHSTCIRHSLFQKTCLLMCLCVECSVFGIVSSFVRNVLVSPNLCPYLNELSLMKITRQSFEMSSRANFAFFFFFDISLLFSFIYFNFQQQISKEQQYSKRLHYGLILLYFTIQQFPSLYFPFSMSLISKVLCILLCFFFIFYIS